MIYIIGHKSPDTDSICSAIALAYLLKEKGMEVEPARAGEINSETKFVLEKFGFEPPQLLENIEEKELILIDHNEKQQMPEGEPKIIEVLDHHKINFSYPGPIKFYTEPVGAIATLITERFSKEGVEIPEKIAGILLSSILSDTVIFKSPTTTEKDRENAKKLNEKLNFDLEEFGKEIKKAGMDLQKPLDELIVKDYKEYTFSGKKFGISQIEIIEIEKFLKERKGEIMPALEKAKKEKNRDCFVFFITDILKKGSQLFVLGEEDKVSEILNIELKNNSAWVEGLMSRKKQIVAPLEENYS